ncbi:putative Co/Zn/Cd efflux system membrane fusion protein [Flavobacterium cauense R2A-7]|uniref:Cobalt-zinc-cadmium efflux system membrane fusion protein n=1 Tax=Flavobacterium cauense R2A-7 TaxID=1341154 RepID=V6RXS8_9FLAO|nr:efflux RND transporter periplasmic adaptor subunit [Flavobacterium cauense]ESU18832.1 putative Co/Zn/Cd efflux system membrane fusion protein [Flavobacterium cauense R2A-7]KGO81701.1 cation transporter [Flavobacterium cauense R2A-7]TWI13729.1 cobalt-zinc-cadmium efflux system membrane fusion protein [Flavobacterium cauense R2A-7]
MKKYFFTLLIATALFSCKKQAPETVETPVNDLISVTKEQFQSGGMQISQPVEQDFDVTVKASGKIDVPPQNRAKVTTFLGGYIKSTTLLVGDKVTKGQALVTLENTDFIDIQKDYLEVAEQIDYLKSEYERQKTLYNEKIASQKNYLKAESDFRRAKAMYNSLREKLLLLNINPKNVENGKLTSTITIYAPISGNIVVMNVNTGMFIAPSDVILEIVQTDHLHLEMAVFEKDILKIKENQPIKFTVPEASKDVFDASVHLVGKSIEGNDRTINVHGHLSDAIKQKLLTGMFVEASIVVDRKKGLAIPTEALITENNKNFVLLLQSDTNNNYSFKKVGVTIGEKSEQFVEIIPNTQVNTNSKLLTKGVFDVAN